MKDTLVTINTKSTIGSIINGVPDGVNVVYMQNIISAPKLALMVSKATLLLCKYETYIQVKFQSKYSARELKLEVVTKNKNEINVYKISSPSKYDRDSINLNSIVSELRELYTKNTFKGIIFLQDSTSLHFYQESIKQLNLQISIEPF